MTELPKENYPSVREWLESKGYDPDELLFRDCVRCGESWALSFVDYYAGYGPRYRAGVCFDCEPEGW